MKIKYSSQQKSYQNEFKSSQVPYLCCNNGWQSAFACQMYKMFGHFSLDFGENIRTKLF